MAGSWSPVVKVNAPVFSERILPTMYRWHCNFCTFHAISKIGRGRRIPNSEWIWHFLCSSPLLGKISFCPNSGRQCSGTLFFVSALACMLGLYTVFLCFPILPKTGKRHKEAIIPFVVTWKCPRWPKACGGLAFTITILYLGNHSHTDKKGGYAQCPF